MLNSIRFFIAVHEPLTPAQRPHYVYGMFTPRPAARLRYRNVRLSAEALPNVVSDMPMDYARPTPGPSSAPDDYDDRASVGGSRFGSYSGYGDNNSAFEMNSQTLVPVDWSKTGSVAQRYRGAYDSLSARRE